MTPTTLHERSERTMHKELLICTSIAKTSQKSPTEDF